MRTLLLWLIFLPGLVLAEDVQLLGTDATCASWIQGFNRFGRAANPEVSVELVEFANQRIWLLGFYSGANMRAATGEDVTVPDELGFISLVNQMCLNKTDDTLAGAANRAMDFLADNRPAEN